MSRHSQKQRISVMVDERAVHGEEPMNRYTLVLRFQMV